MTFLYLLFPMGFLLGFAAAWQWLVRPLRRELYDSDEKLVRSLKSEDDLARENSRLRKLVNPNAGVVQASPKGRWT